MTDLTERKAISWEDLKSLDGTELGIGLPSGVEPKPLEYNLGKVNHYLRETGKDFDDLTQEELQYFRNGEQEMNGWNNAKG
ncbi:hypothetical protein NHG33_08540 [Aerococcaceae bacterium NML130460]|nr:hypothetical protein [Aerococcaceae bacterium NML130460]